MSTLETVSTYRRPSSMVQAEKDAVGLAINTKLLFSGAARLRDLAHQKQVNDEKGID